MGIKATLRCDGMGALTGSKRRKEVVTLLINKGVRALKIPTGRKLPRASEPFLQ